MSRDIFAFDFETTSAKPDSTRVVQLAAMRENEVLFNGLCNPGLAISREAEEVHGISQAMVENAPPDHEEVGKMAQYLIDNWDALYLAGHNINAFDVPILWRIAGVSNPPAFKTIDTMVCALRVLPNAPNHKLTGLIEHLGLGGDEKAHDALGDIQMVFKLINAFKAGLKMTTEELADWLAIPRVLSICTYKKHKGQKWGRNPGDVPYYYAKFLVNNFDSMTKDLALTLQVHYGLRFKGPVF